MQLPLLDTCLLFAASSLCLLHWWQEVSLNFTHSTYLSIIQTPLPHLEKFLGHQVYSYGQLLSITFTSETTELLPSNVNLLLQGSGISLSADLSPQPVLDYDPGLAPRDSFIVRYKVTGMLLSVCESVHTMLLYLFYCWTLWKIPKCLPECVQRKRCQDDCFSLRLCISLLPDLFAVIIYIAPSEYRLSRTPMYRVLLTHIDSAVTVPAEGYMNVAMSQLPHELAVM